MEFFVRKLPEEFINKFSTLLIYAGIKTTPSRFLQNLFNYSFLASIIISLITAYFTKDVFYGGLGFVLAFASINIVAYVGLLFMAENRATFVEGILPDVLFLIAANIRSGLSPDRALIASARDEFGPFKEELERVIKKTLSGGSFEMALKSIKKNIQSSLLSRTVDMISEGIRSGGELATLLEETARDIRQMELIKKEIRTNVLMYIIFIFMASALAGPILYSVSIYLVEMMSKLGSGITIPEEYMAQAPLKITTLSTAKGITSEFLIYFALACIIVTTFFGGLIIGLIETGKELSGFRYVPVLLIIAVAIFFMTRMIMYNVIGAVF